MNEANIAKALLSAVESVRVSFALDGTEASDRIAAAFERFRSDLAENLLAAEQGKWLVPRDEDLINWMEGFR